MANVLVEDSSLTAIANAIRNKNNSLNAKYKPGEMPAAINAIKAPDAGTDFSKATATAADVMSGKTFFGPDGTLTTGVGDQVVIESSDAWGIEIEQSDHQTLTAEPLSGYSKAKDGKYKSTLSASASIEPYVGYVPGAIKKNADEVNHLIRISATDASEIAEMVKDGWVSVYRDEYNFYSDAEYSKPCEGIFGGKILVSGVKESSYSYNYMGSSLYDNSKILSFKDTITTHAYSYLLSGCSNLTSVILSNLTSADEHMLYNCNSLNYVELPNLEKADNDVLEACPNLKSIALNNLKTVNGYLLYNCGNLINVELPKLEKAGAFLLSECPKLTSIALPSLTEADDQLLSECSSLVSANLSKLVSSGMNLLCQCSNLVSVDLSSLVSCGSQSFWGCTTLEKIIRNNPEVPKVTTDGTGWYSLNDIPDTCNLYVPADAVETYKADSNFGTKFKDRIFAIEDMDKE